MRLPSNTRLFLPPFLLGFLALSFQILLLREFSAHFFGNEITFGLALAVWFFWGGLGSILASKIKYSPSKMTGIYCAVILLFPFCLIGLRFSRFILKTLPSEMTGMFPVLIFSFMIAFFISFPLGILFVFNIHFSKGNLSRVYLLEALGSTAAGVLMHFFIIPHFSNWQATSLLGILILLSIFGSAGQRQHRLFFAAGFVTLVSLFFFDFPSQKLFWKPFNLIESKDSPYGKLQIVRTQEQISLYNNSLIVYSFPDLASAEESVHFALLQSPEARDILLVGGGAGGGLTQILKYPQTEVDYVELDPEIIRFSLRNLPEKERKILWNERVHLHFQDGRAFLNESEKNYDVILLNLPEPSSAQINRFYTKEFFQEIHSKLKDKGIFSFRVPSAENYISSELQNFLSSLYYTLKEVFPRVEVVPGSTNIFLASTHLDPLDFRDISEKIKKLHLQNTYVSPELLFARLDPVRVASLREQIPSGKKTLNLDLKPISYFTDAVLWSTQFRGLEAKLLSFLSNVPAFWLLDFPLLLFILMLLILWIKGKKSTFFLVPLALLGLTSVLVTIIVILAFQINYGYLYQRIALLFASFMFGLFLGALFGKKRAKSYSQLLPVQTGFILIISFLLIFLEARPPEISFYIFLLLMGFLSGILFVISNELYLKEKKNFGLGYGLDLLGSFLGALTASSILIPLVGLTALLRYIILFNSFCLVFLFLGWKHRSFS